VIKNSLIVMIMVILVSSAVVSYVNVYAVIPDAPTNLVKNGEPTATTVPLSWTAPANDGGSPITGYQIESAREDPSNFGTFFAFTTVVADTGNVTTHTVTGLTPGDFFQFRVSAINSDGTSSASSTFDIGTQRPADQDFSGGQQEEHNLQQDKPLLVLKTFQQVDKPLVKEIHLLQVNHLLVLV